jgi:hypothetical protein
MKVLSLDRYGGSFKASFGNFANASRGTSTGGIFRQ